MFLEPGWYVSVPLEQTCMASWDITPKPIRERVAPPNTAAQEVAKASALRFVRDLGTVPDCDDPHLFSLHAIEEPIGFDGDFAVREFGKLRDNST